MKTNQNKNEIKRRIKSKEELNQMKNVIVLNQAINQELW